MIADNGSNPRLSFADHAFHDPMQLEHLYRSFCEGLRTADPLLWSEWEIHLRAAEEERDPIKTSLLLVRMASEVSRFVAKLFRIEGEVEALARRILKEADLFRFKTDFVRRKVLPLLRTDGKIASKEDEASVDPLLAAFPGEDLELRAAKAGLHLLDREAALGPASSPEERSQLLAQIEALKRWCAARFQDPAFRSWVIFRFPKGINHFQLVKVKRPDPNLPEALAGLDEALRLRDGFTLTDPRMGEREVGSELHYCILCHERDKDSCAKGFPSKNGKAVVNPLGVPLNGCPLHEKISEMHSLQRGGDAIGALALVMVDNPLCPGTGHRICNDCKVSCIYQKQDPVDIPQIETRVLTDVLSLPWGVEIFGLLTRWNPLNSLRPYALPYNGKNVLVIGLGPAGYTLSHFLLNEGFGVVGIDGLKIEPLPENLVGTREKPPKAIREWKEIYERLDQRVLDGFGGVSEYGITVRWDKNFLTLLHMTLARREKFKIFGGVRFGGTVSLEDAWGYGFHHVAIAAGAGKPTIIDLKNNLVRGVRKASDFLMALQLTGAFKRSALANLQVRLPAIVIGGGLTAIDTATEILAYYPLQVEKALERYEALRADQGEARLRARFDREELAQLDEFLTHGRAVRAERERAARAGEAPNFIALTRSWGGVMIAYRKRMVDSPAYRLNHEEVIKALEEGILFAENLDPQEALADEFGHVRALRFRRQSPVESASQPTSREVELPARSVLVAAGTTPNITYEKEFPGTFLLDAGKKFFEPHKVVKDANGNFRLERSPGAFFTSYQSDGRFVTYYGDNHPAYAGSVVKAMASAKDGYPRIVELFADELRGLDPSRQGEREGAWNRFVERLTDDFTVRVEKVVRLTPTIVEVVVRAPAAARQFHPGQFYRLQNYERKALRVSDRGDPASLLMEGIALTGASVDLEKGWISLIVLEMGVSSRLCAYLRPGEEVVLMGPTGTPTHIPHGENVLLAGGGLGNAVLFSIAKALRESENRVVYFAGYAKGGDLFKMGEIEGAADQVVWSTDADPPIDPRRPQDRHFRGNIVQAMAAYGNGRLGKDLIPLSSVDRIIAIGSDRMMAAVKAARQAVLSPYLKPTHVGVASINSPMQCMMKEVCAQCLQKHIDPETGKETFVFSCTNQDQPMDCVDFQNLAARLRQNSVQEKLSNFWLDHLLKGVAVEHV